MIFAYWHREQGSAELPGGFDLWRKEYPDFRVYGDRDVLPILRRLDGKSDALFQRIRIPACKADIARLALLWEFGGLYVDAHTAPGDRGQLSAIWRELEQVELLLFDRTYDHNDFNPLKLTSSVISSRKHAKALAVIFELAISNLDIHERVESACDGYARYNIYDLTGPRAIRAALYDESRRPYKLKSQFAHIVALYPLVRTGPQPIILYADHRYANANRHWSERQMRERLFDDQSD
jgi:hypothetical protein